MKQNSRTRVKIPTPERLANIALYYLSRFAASEQSLRKILQNRIRKASMRDPAFAAENETHKRLHLAIETIIEKHRKAGSLNDVAYADMKARGLRRAGKSRRAIGQALAKKGIGKELAGKIFKDSEDEADPEEAELKAAKILAKRRKLGPYRAGGASDDRVQQRKDMAVMARGGFSFDVIKKVLGADLEEIEDF